MTFQLRSFVFYHLSGCRDGTYTSYRHEGGTPITMNKKVCHQVMSSKLCFKMTLLFQIFILSLHQIFLSLSYRVSVFRHAWNGFGSYHWQPNYCILTHRPELGPRKRPSPDKPDRLDFVAPASAVHQRVAASRPGRGEAGEGTDRSSREASTERTRSSWKSSVSATATMARTGEWCWTQMPINQRWGPYINP